MIADDLDQTMNTHAELSFNVHTGGSFFLRCNLFYKRAPQNISDLTAESTSLTHKSRQEGISTHYFFLFLHKKTHVVMLWVLCMALLMSSHNIMLSWRNKKNVSTFRLKKCLNWSDYNPDQTICVDSSLREFSFEIHTLC